MKFAALRQHEVKTLGADALEDSLAYDQKAILETNLDYITKSLGRKGGREGGREGEREGLEYAGGRCARRLPGL